MDLPIIILDLLVLVSSLVAFLAIRDYRKRGGLPYPPGPRPLPLIGNFFDFKKEFNWLSFIQLSNRYGDILSFHVFNQVIVVLNSIKTTKDLEKRVEIYSDRPVIPIIEMMRWDWLVPLTRDTKYWRQARKVLDRGLRPAVIASYRPLQQRNVHDLLARLLADPNDLEAHLASLIGGLSLGIAYGYQVKGPNDRRITVVRSMIRLASNVFLPGAALVNLLPFLRHIPEWVPWLSYQPLARRGYDLGQEVLHGLMEYVREGILNGTAQPSLALEGLQEAENLKGREREKAEETIAGAVGSIYAAATDTLVAAVLSFFVAALLHPDIKAMAQKELDATTKRERLPTFEDRPALPFIDAICKEVLRWKPPLPLGIPHTAKEDDVYEGFFIPKGALVFGNAWAILHDPVMYPEPDSFKPERFLNPDGSSRDDPVLSSVFGFGKRICPGRHLANDELFIIVASLLCVFDIEKEKDTGGDPQAFSYTGTAISRPNAFRCSIIPRDKQAEELIAGHVQTH